MPTLEHEEEGNKALIEELRKRLLSRGPELKDFNEKDIDRVQQNDLYVWLFLKDKEKDLEKAQEMMVECLRCRESFGINTLIERNIDRRLFEIGFLYPRNKDRNGNSLLLFHAKLYKKELYDLEEVKKLFAFGLEKMSCNNIGKKVTLLFDMQDAGLSNMDLDLIKFIITCFQTYFPSMLEYLIVFETPWILTDKSVFFCEVESKPGFFTLLVTNEFFTIRPDKASGKFDVEAAWKIVKTWLSTDGISKIKFVNKTEIDQYISSDQLLTSLGGEDDFVYSYPPQLFSGPKEMKDRSKILEVPSNPDVFSSISMSIDASGSKDAEDSYSKTQSIKRNGEIDFSSIEHSFGEVQQIKPEEKVRRRRNRGDRNMVENAGPLVTISPAYDLTFCGPPTLTTEVLQILRVTNTVSSTVAYKIKTTSPENFRVRPSSGPLRPGDSVEVNIFLQPGHETRLSKDKFLILSTIVPEQEKGDLSSMWKNIPRSSIMEQRLRCRYEQTANISNENSDHDSLTSANRRIDYDPLVTISNQFMDFNSKVSDVESKLQLLDRDMRKMFRLVVVLLVALILTLTSVVVYLWRDQTIR